MDEAWAWADEPAAPAPADDGPFAVWPENWDTVCLFWSVRRCWLHFAMGGVMGMDWTQIQARMQLKGFGRRRMARETDRLEMMQDAIMEVKARWTN